MTTSHTRIPARRPLRTIAAVAGGAAAVLVLAACSSAAIGATPTPAASQGADQGQQNRGGISGLIASAQDDVLQVQGASEQTAVRYTDATTVRRTTAVDASTIKVGDCIVAITGQDSDTATTITVAAASDDGTCSTGFGGGRGGGAGTPSDAPSGAPGDGQGSRGARTPSGAPSGGVAPSGGPSGGQGGFGGFTTGKVTAVTATSLSVETTAQDGSTSTADVALASGTTVTTTVDASASDIAVGLCVTAMGTADDKGGYDATSLTLSDPDSNGSCTAGFGGFPGRGDGQGSSGDDEDGSNG